MVGIIVMLSIQGVPAQTPPPIEWQKSLGGSHDDRANCIFQTVDGGFIVVGMSSSNDGEVSGHHGMTSQQNYDLWVVKLNNSGTLQWQKSYGGTRMDYGDFVRQTSDGGYIISGMTNSDDGDVVGWHPGYASGSPQADAWIVKIDGSGNLQWQKTLGGSSEEIAHCVQQTSDGNYIVAGYTYSTDGDVVGSNGENEYWVVKLDATTQNIIWQKTLGGTSHERGAYIEQTSDGNYLVSGFSNSKDGDVSANHGSYDYWVLKLSDATQNILWEKSLGGMLNDEAGWIRQTTDGNYIIGGHTRSVEGDVSGNHGNAGSTDYWIVKLDGITRNILWQKALGGTGEEYFSSIQQTSDGGYIVGGYTFSNNGNVTGLHGANSDYWIVKLDSNGNIEWQKTLGGTGTDFGGYVQQTTDGGYVIVGGSHSGDGDVTSNHGDNDYWVVKLEGNGTTPACITWNLLSDSLVTSTSGGLQGQPEVVGSGSGNPMSVWGYNSNGQELWCGFNGWQQGSLDFGRYIQFDVTPASGNDFKVNNISFDYNDFQNGVDMNTIVFRVGYSLDQWNTVTLFNQLPFTYLGTSVQTFIASANIVVPDGKTFSFRIFPYGLKNQQASSPTRATHKNVTICGATYPSNSCACCDTAHVTVYDTITTYITVADTLVIPISTGIASVPSNTLKVYPNPAHNHLVIDNGNYSVMSSYSVKITNILGQEVFTQTINQQQFNIDISTWSAGNYMISVLDALNNVKVSKVIVIQ